MRAAGLWNLLCKENVSIGNSPPGNSRSSTNENKSTDFWNTGFAIREVLQNVVRYWSIATLETLPGRPHIDPDSQDFQIGLILHGTTKHTIRQSVTS